MTYNINDLIRYLFIATGINEENKQGNKMCKCCCKCCKEELNLEVGKFYEADNGEVFYIFRGLDDGDFEALILLNGSFVFSERRRFFNIHGTGTAYNIGKSKIIKERKDIKITGL